MADGSAFTRKVLDRGVMKQNCDTTFIENEMEQMEAKTIIED